MRLTLTRFFQPKRTVMYPEVKPDIAPRNRGRLELVTDEHGTLKCETCFQCAQACPIECIDMGGTDTKGRFAVHWGPAEQYAERREESAMRRSGRTVSDAAAATGATINIAKVDEILEAPARGSAEELLDAGASDNLSAASAERNKEAPEPALVGLRC